VRILIVEDEQRLAQALTRLFRDEKIAADVAGDGEDGLYLAESGVYDLIVLDRMLPGMSGLDILRQLRKKNIATPVLMLTARDSIQDRVDGLNAGADDYLVKPFATEELLARVHALSRRPTEMILDATLRFESLVFDTTRRTIHCGDEANAEQLSPKESQILELLIRHAGQVLTRRQLMDGVWGYEADVLEGVLDTYVHHLRRRLTAVCGPTIRTIRGVGYSLERNATP
jgi:DNA-binding response OmpR family regulator